MRYKPATQSVVNEKQTLSREAFARQLIGLMHTDAQRYTRHFLWTAPTDYLGQYIQRKVL